MKNSKVLVVTTSHDKLGDSGEKTGVWLEELAGPYYQFLDSGFSVTIASVKGGSVPLDPKSQLEEWQTSFTKRFLEDSGALSAIQNTEKVTEVNPDEFDILFFPGGHGPMWDLGDNAEVAKLINAFDTNQKPIGLVCHGVVALKGVETMNGSPFVKGKRVTSFTNSEEEAVGLTSIVPFLLEDALKDEGAIYVKRQDWSDFVVADGNLVTGQNPQSSVSAAQKTIELLTNQSYNNLKTDTMITTDKRKEIASAFFQAYNNQDTEKAASLASENGTFRYIPLGDNGRGGIKAGDGTTWTGIANALISSFPEFYLLIVHYFHSSKLLLLFQTLLDTLLEIHKA